MKTISADATVTELQVIEPQILSADFNVTTNFEEVKQNLKAITEKYIGLVVTDQNQKDMEKLSAKSWRSGRVFRNLKLTGNGSSAARWINSRMPARNF